MLIISNENSVFTTYNNFAIDSYNANDNRVRLFSSLSFSKQTARTVAKNIHK
jgi:hypothetical protein